MRLLVLAALAATALGIAPAAPAATVERDDVDTADVSYLAAAGEANRVVVRAENGGFRFTDPGAVLATRSCTQLGPHDVFCEGIADTLIVETGDGDDAIDATAAPSAFAVGGDGDDVVAAARASGGAGNDVLRGIGVAGNLHGGPGDDVVTAGPRGDRLFGGDGNDTLAGGAGADTIYGGEGSCAACATPVLDHDVLRGGAGNDVLAVERGRDRLDGGTGNDRYVVHAAARGIAATIADSGRDRRDAISVACKGVKLTATAGTRDRRGRYRLPGGFVAFAGLDGRLPCAARPSGSR
jgi:Ca2+-binding RTX toxin-like protein